MNRKKITGYILIFIGIYLFMNIVFPNKKEETNSTNTANAGVTLDPIKKDFTLGETVKVEINNTSTGSIVFTPAPCPLPPLTVLKDNQVLSPASTYRCANEPFEIKANTKHMVTFDKWNNALFSSEGEYTISYLATINNQPQEIKNTIKVNASNWFGTLWDAAFYRPIYNTLIYLTDIMPGHDLGWAIIVLTILIRIILLIPNQKALEQQKKLQKIQPKIAELQKKYEGDQQKIGEETLKLWKEHKVNPMGSCLPMLLQLPVLIALYSAISNGLDAGSTYFLYEPLKGFNIDTIHANFLGILDLSVPNIIVLPIILAVLQFIQMKLSLGNAKAKKDAASKDKKADAPSDPNAMMSKSMTYFFPVMIGFMAMGFPAGVSLYWGVSTIFGILQQIWVNREKTIV